MKETMFEDSSPEERVQLLSDNCYFHDDTILERFHTPEEKEALRNVTMEETIRCQEIEDQIRSLTEPLKGELKIIKSSLKDHVSCFKRGYEPENVRLYAFDDQENSTMNYYDHTGKFIKSRRLTPSERQSKIFNIGKDVSNG